MLAASYKAAYLFNECFLNATVFKDGRGHVNNYANIRLLPDLKIFLTLDN